MKENLENLYIAEFYDWQLWAITGWHLKHYEICTQTIRTIVKYQLKTEELLDLRKQVSSKWVQEELQKIREKFKWIVFYWKK